LIFFRRSILDSIWGLDFGGFLSLKDLKKSAFINEKAEALSFLKSFLLDLLFSLSKISQLPHLIF